MTPTEKIDALIEKVIVATRVRDNAWETYQRHVYFLGRNHQATLDVLHDYFLARANAQLLENELTLAQNEGNLQC